MSMFYELMMRSKMKVEEMPLTVVGNPTIVNGVVSGFSANDYLSFNVADYNAIQELCLVFEPTNLLSANTGLLCNKSGQQGFKITSSNNFVANYYFNDGQYFNLGVLSLSANKKYKANLKYDNIENFTLNTTVDNTTTSYNYIGNNTGLRNNINANYNTLMFGVGATSYQAFDGKIYLPECYIKLNNTKYLFTISQ